MIIVSERQKARCEEGEGVQGQVRAEKKVSGDQESTEQCFANSIPFIQKKNKSDQIWTLTYQHMTSKATVHKNMGCESHQVETPSSNSRF